MIDDEICRSPLTDAEIGALADGVIEALSTAALEHAETCPSCSMRVADEAMLALQVGGALMALAAEPANAKAEPTSVSVGRAAVPSPTTPILIAVVVATLASLPLVPSFGRSSMLLITSGEVYRNAVWQGVTALVGSLNGPIVTFTVAAGLVALSAIVARFSHRLTTEGAVK